MWRSNKWHEVEVSIYNEEDPTDLEGGKAIRKITTPETVRIFPLREGTMFLRWPCLTPMILEHWIL